LVVDCFAAVIQEVAQTLCLNVEGHILAGANHWIPEEQSDWLDIKLAEFIPKQSGG
jgi:hypothetical protein